MGNTGLSCVRQLDGAEKLGWEDLFVTVLILKYDNAILMAAGCSPRHMLERWSVCICGNSLPQSIAGLFKKVK